MAEYKDTLNLPQTAFSMKANLANKEPERLKKWQDENIYEQIRMSRQGQPKYILHDGPPYANGDIHLGHCVNKIIKDLILKSKNMSGYDTPYVPGWDCHGLPIEINVEKKIGRAGQKVSHAEFRQACREYALKQVDNQKQSFMRLGVFGEWDKPYLTINPEYEAGIIRSLAKIIDNGHLHQGYKPVQWCMDCGSALAEAEVEYKDKTSPAVDVKFPFVDREKLNAGVSALSKSSIENISCVIWTTTPWTLPSNKAVCLHPEVNYAFVQFQGEQGDELIVLAEDLVDDCMQRYGIEDYHTVAVVAGHVLEGLETKHPWFDSNVPVILGEHVTVEAGTGCVHTAPGHGEDDFNVGQKYHLNVEHLVDGKGCFVGETPTIAGMHITKANDVINETLKEQNRLMHVAKIEHSYPHCWRHKTPIIFRATPQWFISMDKSGLRKDALKSIEQVKWLPEWGESRIYNMVEQRPDWCISRQRTWTMPITSYIHKDTGDLHPKTQSIMQTVADAVEKSNMEAWYEMDDRELIGDDVDDYHKIRDGLDVWFDSGVSHACVLGQNDDLHVPADLYLEGSDQHRGWFQSSLLTSVAMNGHAPYKQVVTHGFTVDKNGHKMSKSIGNTIAPEKIINRLGVDIMRLWVSSLDFRNDQVCSDEIFNRIADAYRRIRNTARFLLANLNGFDPENDVLSLTEMVALDRYIVRRAQQVQSEIIDDFESFQFHHIYQLLHNFCSVDLGSFYLDIIKDRQYTAKQHTKAHQSAQTAMYYIAEMLVRWLAPITPFTADEIWEHMPGQRDASVFLETWFDVPSVDFSDDFSDDDWRDIMRVRDEVNKCLEKARNEKLIGSGLDAHVVLYAHDRVFKILNQLGDELRFVLITSQATLHPMDAREDEGTLTDMDGLAVEVVAIADEKCERCWQRREDVGKDATHKTLCGRCVVNIEGEGETREYA